MPAIAGASSSVAGRIVMAILVTEQLIERKKISRTWCRHRSTGAQQPPTDTPDLNRVSAACASPRMTLTTPSRTSGSRSCSSCFCCSMRSSVMRLYRPPAAAVTCRAVARPSASSARCSDISLLHQRADDPARRALVQKQSLRQRAQPHRRVLDERLQRVALRDGDVVAADAIAIPELVDPHELRDRRLEGGGVPFEIPGLPR